MRKPGVLIFVHPEFRKKLKIDSAMNNMSIIDFTKELGKKKGSLFDKREEEEQPKFGFRI